MVQGLLTLKKLTNWTRKKKEKEKRVAYTSPLKGQAFEKIFKKEEEEEEEKSYVGPKGAWKSLSNSLQFIGFPSTLADSTLIILFVGNLWILFFLG
jgi:hypothetical protein